MTGGKETSARYGIEVWHRVRVVCFAQESSQSAFGIHKISKAFACAFVSARAHTHTHHTQPLSLSLSLSLSHTHTHTHICLRNAQEEKETNEQQSTIEQLIAQNRKLKNRLLDISATINGAPGAPSCSVSVSVHWSVTTPLLRLISRSA